MFFSCLFLLTQYFFNRFRFLVWSSQIKILYLQDLTNIDLFLTSREVEESLLRHETGPCLAWCYDNKSKLRKNKVCLKEINSFIAHTWFHIIFWMWIFIWIEDFKQWFLVCLSDFLSVCLSVLSILDILIILAKLQRPCNVISRQRSPSLRSRSTLTTKFFFQIIFYDNRRYGGSLW